MRIGVLTGGGDVPGLNPAIKAVVRRATAAGHDVIGFRRGWAGLLQYNLDDPDSSAQHIEHLDPLRVRTVDRTGGTFLHSSRTNPAKVKPDAVPDFLKGAFPVGENGTVDCTPHALRVLESLGVSVLTPIGGDDTLSYGLRLHQEGMKVVAIPKTMDNDVNGTDYCIGFSTAVSRSVEFMTMLRTPTGSHERIAVVELFGRNSGETTLISTYLADGDIALIPEVPFDIQKVADLVMAAKNANPSGYALVAVAEGAIMQGSEVIESGEADAFGHRKLGGIGKETGDALAKLTGQGIIGQQLGYLMRAGAPDALDKMIATNYGTLAVDRVLEGHSGEMVALQKGCYTTVPMEVIGQSARRVDVSELYDAATYSPHVRNLVGKPMFLY